MSIAWEEHSRCSVAIDTEKKKRYQRCKHSIVSLCILGIFLLGVSDRGRYTRGVFQSRVENIRRIYAFLSALVAADRVFHLYVAFYWKYLSRKGYLDKFKRPNGKRVPSYSMEEIQQSFARVVVVVFAAGRGVLLNHPKRCRPTSNV